MSEGTLKFEDGFANSKDEMMSTGVGMYQSMVLEIYRCGLIDTEEALKRLGFNNWEEIIKRMEKRCQGALTGWVKGDVKNEKS